jgi:hypothetical protein
MRNNQLNGFGFRFVGLAVVFAAISIFGGCGRSGLSGYKNTWLYPGNVDTVYVEMFDSASYRRGHEYTLTDAICKRIEAETPYKIVSDRDFADTVLSGQITSIGSGILAMDRETGRPLEHEVQMWVTVSWKNTKTGELLINNETVTASSTYSSQLGQDFGYSAAVAANKAAEKVVELMEEKW